ncbi:MAG: DUF3291 domain-containing protein [Mycobacteriales bacterium]
MIPSLIRTPWVSQSRVRNDRVLVFASRFDGPGPRAGRRLLAYGIRVRANAIVAKGCLGAAVLARPVKGAYYTLSVWQDEPSLQAFAHGKGHRTAVRAMRASGPFNGVLISWWAPAGERRPHWNEVLRRTTAAEPGPYRGPEREPARAADV